MIEAVKTQQQATTYLIPPRIPAYSKKRLVQSFEAGVRMILAFAFVQPKIPKIRAVRGRVARLL